MRVKIGKQYAVDSFDLSVYENIFTQSFSSHEKYGDWNKCISVTSACNLKNKVVGCINQLLFV